MKAIVYTSNSGFTKHYAELLAAETGLPIFELKNAAGKLNTGEEIIYMGWLIAGNIKGYKKAAKRYGIKAVCAVGMTRPSDKLISEIRDKHSITDAEVFYLQGGFNMEKLHGVYKLMMKAMAKTISKGLEAKAEKTAEEAEMLDMYKNGSDMVRIENLSGAIEWYRGQA